MPFKLLKLTSSLPVHHHRQNRWLRRAITTGKSRTQPALCSGWWRKTTSVPHSHVIRNNDNNRLGLRGPKNFRYCSGNKGGKVSGAGKASIESVNSDNRDDKWTTESDLGTSVMPTLSSHNHRHLKPSPSQRNPSAKLLTLPTILTIARVAAVPILVSAFYMNSRLGTTATTSTFIAAAITDWLDGYLARRMNLGTAFGAFLDPVADKLMVAATLVLLCTRPPEAAMFVQLPWLLTVPSIAIIGREKLILDHPRHLDFLKILQEPFAAFSHPIILALFPFAKNMMPVLQFLSHMELAGGDALTSTDKDDYRNKCCRLSALPALATI